MATYANRVFAPLDDDHSMERLAGGNETEVYRTDDRRYVVKIKNEEGGTLSAALLDAQQMRASAEEFVVCLGDEYTIPSFYVISQDDVKNVQVLVIQPFLHNAYALATVDYTQLNRDERRQVCEHLLKIIHRATKHYHSTGHMPDLYGRSNTSSNERKALNAPHKLPWRIWSFLVKRSLLHSHNLLLLRDPSIRVVLVDYDAVRRSALYRMVYFAVRWWLFWRDRVMILWMAYGRRKKTIRNSS